MRARKLSRWLGRVVAVAAFSVAAMFGSAATVSASDAESDGGATQAEAASDDASPDTTSWE